MRKSGAICDTWCNLPYVSTPEYELVLTTTLAAMSTFACACPRAPDDEGGNTALRHSSGAQQNTPS